MKDFLKKVKHVITCVFTRHISSIFVGICLTLCSIVILCHHFSPTTSMALCPFTVIGVTLIFIVANSHAYKKKRRQYKQLPNRCRYRCVIHDTTVRYLDVSHQKYGHRHYCPHCVRFWIVPRR